MVALPSPRGEISESLIEHLRGSPDAGSPPCDTAAAVAGPLGDDDLQLALYLCYELHYRGLKGVDEGWEWDPSLLAFRASLEEAFIGALMEEIGPPSPFAGGVGEALFALVAADEGRSMSLYLQSRATVEQFREFLMHRSAYQLKEADPHSWALPRLVGPAKAALVEVQTDEYGGGDPDRMHSVLFANSMQAIGLEPTYGAYVEQLPGTTLATVNLMTFFGLHRRWRGAIVGHLAAFEISSAQPNRRYAQGLRRLGFGEDATEFFDEHVEADSVHENIAAYDLAGGLARSEPQLAPDIIFGARALLRLDKRFAESLLSAWDRGASAMLEAPAAALA